MKTTLELPDELMRRLKIRAAKTDRKLKDTVTEVIRHGLSAVEPAQNGDPVKALASRLEFRDDGTVINPAGLDESDVFFDALDEIREKHEREVPTDPLA